MEVTQGLFDQMVLQRNRRDVCDVPIEGRCAVDGAVEVRVTRSGRVVRGYNWKRIGTAKRGRLSARLRGLKVGGPYDITLRITTSKRSGDADEFAVRDVLVGDVWVLAGQSNMQGCGRYRDRAKPHAQVRACYLDDHWAVAEDPIHDLWNAVDEVHHEIKGGRFPDPPRRAALRAGVGPGVAFGIELQRATGVPQGLIACAHGGTTMAQWDPKLKRGGSGHSLYAAMLRRIGKCGGRVAGLAWYQGESDAINSVSQQYTRRMVAFFKALRRDLDDARLPIAIVQLGRYAANAINPVEWNSIQEQQRRLSERIDHLAVVPAIDLELDDAIHIGGADQQRLGKRLAQAMLALRGDRGKVTAPITLKRVSLRKSGPLPMGEVVLEYANVAGRLRAPGRAMGFACVNGAAQRPMPFATRLDGQRVILETGRTMHELSSDAVQYGLGCDPACNVVDEADRSLPVLGPIALGQPRAVGAFVRKAAVSELMPMHGRIGELECPDAAARRRWKTRRFVTDFFDMHARIAASGTERQVLYFACRFHCSERMRLGVCLGYDGPVKVWCDGKAMHTDAAGTNPAIPDEVTPRITAARGDHELVIALETNRGRAYGAYVRFERLDVPRGKITDGPTGYVMPKVDV